jgi:Amt family ammonium transporter
MHGVPAASCGVAGVCAHARCHVELRVSCSDLLLLPPPHRYGFNPGSTLNITSASVYATSGRAACCTTLSGAAGCLTALALGFLRHRAWDLLAVCNGTLVGLVSITASCSVVEPWAALLAGSVGVCIFEAVCTMFLKFQIDDPLAAAPMHGFGGAWGCIFAGLMAKQEYMAQVRGQGVCAQGLAVHT